MYVIQIEIDEKVQMKGEQFQFRVNEEGEHIQREMIRKHVVTCTLTSSPFQLG